MFKLGIFDFAVFIWLLTLSTTTTTMITTTATTATTMGQKAFALKADQNEANCPHVFKNFFSDKIYNLTLTK